MRELRKEMQDREAGGKKCKKKLAGVKQMLIKGWHQQNFHQCFLLQGGTGDIGGCQDPISSLVSLP